MHVTRIIAAAIAVLLSPPVVRAQDASSAEEVAQRLANPAAQVTALTNQVRLQPGAGDGNLNAQLRLQPVIPVSLPNSWALLTRTIVPISSNGYRETAFGLGDISLNGYFVPPPMGNWFIGIGPSVSLPATTHRTLGSRNYAAGPSAIVSRQGDPLTVGFLATHLWTFAQPEGATRTTTSTFQPFVAYNLGQGRTATLNTEIVYNWEAPAGRQWVMPVSAGLSQVLPIGENRFVQLGGALTHYVAPQPGAGVWEVRLNATFVLPN